MGKIFFYFGLAILVALMLTNAAQAVCPVCTVAVGAGIGLSRWLGIDDAITGLWIGAVIVSLIFWTANFFKKRKINFPLRGFLITLFWYLLILIPLWLGKIIGHPYNKFCGVDKILFGASLGSIVFLLAVWLNNALKNKKGKSLFLFQKVVIPILFLVIASIILHLIIKCQIRIKL